eukprot:9465553-Alexandrium_andersonii.AAC.1
MARRAQPGRYTFIKAVNGDIIDRRVQFVNLHWEDGRTACAPRLDGFRWDQLGPSPKASGRGP